MESISFSMATCNLSKPWTFYSLFRVPNGLVLIIDSVGVASSQCYKYFFHFPFVFHKTHRSPFISFCHRTIALLFRMSAWNNVVDVLLSVQLISLLRAFIFIDVGEKNSQVVRGKLKFWELFKSILRVGHLIHTIIISALASVNEDFF